VTERSIQNALFDYLRWRGYLLACPNYTPVGWWECDLLGITKAGFAVEFEIKLTRADFKADAGKAKVRFGMKDGRFGKIVGEAKHDLLACGHEKGPNRFFYVVPDGMLSEEDVPEWAGLIACLPYHGDRISLVVRKEAPKLHKQKADERVIHHMSSVFYWRFWNLRRGLTELEVPA
jgi:hypothetical protein